MRPPIFSSAIIVVTRIDIFDAFRSELKDMDVPHIIAPEGVALTLEALQKNPGGLLAIDWACGAGKVAKILEAVREPFRGSVRPVFLFTSEDDANLSGVAMEYGVTRVHAGQITRKIIGDHLKAIATIDLLPEELQNTYTQARKAVATGETAVAKALLATLHEKSSDNARVAQDYAEFLFAEGDVAEALRVVTPLAAVADATPRALNLMGRLLMRAGKFEAAAIALNRAKLINPFHLDRLMALGESYLHLDMFDRAKENFQQALDADPKSEAALGGMSKALLLTGDTNDALVLLKQLSGPREMASVFNAAAVIAMRGKRFKEGSDLYNIALRAVGADPRVLSKLAYNMGIGYYRKHDEHAAHECFAVAVKLDPKNAKASTNFAMNAAKLGTVNLPEDKVALIERLIAINNDKGHLGEQQGSVDEAS